MLSSKFKLDDKFITIKWEVDRAVYAFVTFTAKEYAKDSIEKLNGLEYNVLLTFIRNLFESPFSLNENLT